MKVLLTGSTGFVGKQLLQGLAQSDHSVIAAVRSGSRTGTASPTENARDKVLFLKVEKLSDINAADFKEHNIDTVVHCAGLAHSPDATAEQFHEVNTQITLALAENAARAGAKRFIFLSSIGVNGARSLVPFSAEDDSAPYDAYTHSKLKAEEGLFELSKKTDMEVVVIRPPLIYGKGAPGNFAKLVKLASLPVPLPFGAINNNRSFVSIVNLVDFILVCIAHSAAANNVFLVSDGEDLSTSEFLRKISVAMSRKPKLVPVPVSLLKWLLMPVGANKLVDKLAVDLQIDITKNIDLLGWKPPFSIDDSLNFLSRGR